MKSMFAAVVVFAGLTGLAAAEAPVAVVEDVQGTVAGVEFMDYVAPGKVIKLGPNGAVVLGYYFTYFAGVRWRIRTEWRRILKSRT